MAVPKKKAAPKKKSLTTVKSQTHQLVEKDESAMVIPQTQSPMQQLAQMKDLGLTVAEMKEMLELQKSYEANEALKIFNLSLANFKAEAITIEKDGHVKYASDKSPTGFVEYDHATLGNIVKIVTPYLSKHGFSHRWKTEQTDKGGIVKVTFVLTHMAGHSEETPLQAGLDATGGKNNHQALASSVKYLQRYTFLAGTGLAVEEGMADDDGRESGDSIELISEQQVADLWALAEEVNADLDNFLAFCGVEKIADLPLTRWDKAVKALEDKRAL